MFRCGAVADAMNVEWGHAVLPKMTKRRPSAVQVADVAWQRQGLACARCGAKNQPGRHLLLKVERQSGRHVPPTVVCARGCPSYVSTEEGLRGGELEVALRSLDPRFVEYVTRRPRGRGRPRRMSIIDYQKKRARALARLGPGATKAALRRAVRLPERTFFRYEAELESAADQ